MPESWHNSNYLELVAIAKYPCGAALWVAAEEFNDVRGAPSCRGYCLLTAKGSGV